MSRKEETFKMAMLSHVQKIIRLIEEEQSGMLFFNTGVITCQIIRTQIRRKSLQESKATKSAEMLKENRWRPCESKSDKQSLQLDVLQNRLEQERKQMVTT